MIRPILVSILVFSFFARVYNIAPLLGFWYDQGRDAKVIWQLWHQGKFFLIGPTTGIEGIFLGPFYYYLIAPFYLLGNGDPVVPALFLACLTTASVYLIYRVVNQFSSPAAALIASGLYGLSSSIIQYNRWLSNPTPLPFFALISFYCLAVIIHGGRSQLRHWLILGLTVGLGLQLEAASAIFFLPAIFIVLFLLLPRKGLSVKFALFGLLAFVVTLLPQIVFNFRHQQILLRAFENFLLVQSSFRPAVTDLFASRLKDYFGFFFGKIFPDTPLQLLLAFFLSFAVVVLRRYLVSKLFLASCVWWLTPMLFLLFYHGNHGYVWDYYFTGSYPIFSVSLGLIFAAALRRRRAAAAVAAVFLALFLQRNLSATRAFLVQTSPPYVTLATISAAVDSVYADAQGEPFNVDVYVPPQISHAYDYVFLWRGKYIHGYQPQISLVPRLYTLLEPDPQRPILRQKWLDRQDTYGPVIRQWQIDQALIQSRLRHRAPHP